MPNSSINRNYHQRAEKLIEVNRFREAIPLFTKAVTENPHDYYAMCGLAFCFYKLEDYERCIPYAKKGIVIDPECEWAYFLQGLAVMRQGDYQAGERFLEKAVSLKPDDEDALKYLGFTYLETGKLNEARVVAEKVLEIAPHSEETHYLYGTVENKIGNYQEAEKWFRQALEIKPDYAEARSCLAILLLKQSGRATNKDANKLESQGLKHLLESFKIDPNNKFNLDNLKSELDNSSCYFVLIYLFPLFLLGLWATPFVTVFLSFSLILLIQHQIKQNIQRKKKLPPEIKSLLKVQNYAHFMGEQAAKFVDCGRYLYKRIGLQICIALAVFFVYFFTQKDNPSFGFLVISNSIIVVNTGWLFYRMLTYIGHSK